MIFQIGCHTPAVVTSPVVAHMLRWLSQWCPIFTNLFQESASRRLLETRVFQLRIFAPKLDKSQVWTQQGSGTEKSWTNITWEWKSSAPIEVPSSCPWWEQSRSNFFSRNSPILSPGELWVGPWRRPCRIFWDGWKAFSSIFSWNCLLRRVIIRIRHLYNWA